MNLKSIKFRWGISDFIEFKVVLVELILECIWMWKLEKEIEMIEIFCRVRNRS